MNRISFQVVRCLKGEVFLTLSSCSFAVSKNIFPFVREL
jgi:hypothetical protein